MYLLRMCCMVMYVTTITITIATEMLLIVTITFIFFHCRPPCCSLNGVAIAFFALSDFIVWLFGSDGRDISSFAPRLMKKAGKRVTRTSVRGLNMISAEQTTFAKDWRMLGIYQLRTTKRLSEIFNNVWDPAVFFLFVLLDKNALEKAYQRKTQIIKNNKRSLRESEFVSHGQNSSLNARDSQIEWRCEKIVVLLLLLFLMLFNWSFRLLYVCEKPDKKEEQIVNKKQNKKNNFCECACARVWR